MALHIKVCYIMHFSRTAAIPFIQVIRCCFLYESKIYAYFTKKIYRYFILIIYNKRNLSRVSIFLEKKMFVGQIRPTELHK